jgi:small conductance mechanosensitive channel
MDSELIKSLDDLRLWAIGLNPWPERALLAAGAVFGGYLIGLIVALVTAFIARRLSGFTHNHGKGKAGEKAAPTTDSIAIDILGSVIKLFGLLAGVAIAAWLFGYPIETLQTVAVRTVLSLVILVAVWFLGAWLGGRVRSFGDRVGRGSHAGSRTLFSFLSSLVRIGALAIGVIAALQQFGFPITSLVAVIGAAGLAIALALQDTLKAVASGVVIAIFRPYRIGDVVHIGGQDGTVADITPFTTVLNTVDNRQVVMTNDKAWGDVIINNTARGRRRLDITFSIDYDDDIDHAINVITDVLKSDPRVRTEPPIWVKVTELASSSVDLRARAWCKSDDWWDLRCDMLKNVKQAFDRNGITIPYPHQTDVEKYPDRARLVRQISEMDEDHDTRDVDDSVASALKNPRNTD